MSDLVKLAPLGDFRIPSRLRPYISYRTVEYHWHQELRDFHVSFEGFEFDGSSEFFRFPKEIADAVCGAFQRTREADFRAYRRRLTLPPAARPEKLRFNAQEFLAYISGTSDGFEPRH